MSLFPAAAGAQDTSIDFDRDIRPILSDNCFFCHGPDDEHRQADLRLDTREGLFGDLGGYAPVVPNDPEASELLQRVLTTDPDMRMPPPESKRELTKEEKELLRAWIEQGAPWTQHWAFVPPDPPPVPPDPTGWSNNEIDCFIAAAARRAGLQPAPAASREKLIRRVTMDLTGVPPTPQEVEAFVHDDSLGAYEKLVDRLLASPRYGERMAWDWLEAGRYADTDGFQGDPTRTMWPWRDWLVNALNDNMPFDEFTVTMLAGDLLPDATPEQIIATAFNRNHMFNGEGGRIPEETRVENVFDRTETVATVWLGLTFTCCRCHDHKYDPFTQEDYYRFFAYFNNTSEDGRSGRGKTPPVYAYLYPGWRQQKEELTQQVAALEQRMWADRPELDARQVEWEERMVGHLGALETQVEWGPWYYLGPIPTAAGDAFAKPVGPEVDLARPIDVNATIDQYHWKPLPALQDGKVFELPSEIGANYLLRQVRCPTDRSVQLSLGSDDGIKIWVNGKLVFTKDVTRGVAPNQDTAQIDLEAGTNQLLIKIANSGGPAGIYFQPQTEAPLGLTPEVVKALQTLRESRSPTQRRTLREHFRRQHWPEWANLSREIDQLKQQIASIDKQAVQVMVMDELAKRRPTYVLERGNYQKPTQEVQPGTPPVFPPAPSDRRADRLQLAQWLVSPENPLTARVTVNRIWQTFFGRGLVATPEDFGSQGQRPTHPELLDWLAIRFIQSGWDVKQLHRLIVLSNTYRQSSGVTEAALSRDPENLWLARSPRYRWPSWMLRDQALALGGLISYRLGGPPVKPYQPDGLWAEATFGKIKYQRDQGESLYRRSLYVFWRRIVGPPMFFDAAKRQTCEVRPVRTNTPLHALTVLNETAFVECARGMAARVMRQGGDDIESQLRYAFRLATSRWPSERELKVLQSRLERSRELFQAQPDDALALLAVGESPRDEKLDPIDHAALTVICNLLLNLDEVLCRE